MMKKKILILYLILVLSLLLERLKAQAILELPSIGCGRLLNVNQFGADRGADGTILNPGICLGRIGRVAENPSRMVDTNINSYGRLYIGVGAAINCRMFLAAYRNDGIKFSANKPIYIDIEAQGFNFNSTIDNVNVLFYNGSNFVSRQSLGGKFFIDFGGNAARKLVKFIPPAQWDRIEIETKELAGIGFTFSEIKVYNIFSEFYRLQNLNFNLQPSDKTILEGASTNMQTSIVSGNGIPSGITYQWQVNIGNGWINLSNNSVYAGVNTENLQINNAPGSIDLNKYRLTAQSQFGTCRFSGISDEAILRVNYVLGGQIGSDQSFCTGSINNPAAFVEIASAMGSGNLSYQWESSFDNINFTNISGADTATYDVPSGISQTTYYRRKVTSTLNAATTSAYSNVITVSVLKCYLECIISNQMNTIFLK
jgi:hypothetical protein